MKILSFDVGIVNLAYCIVETNIDVAPKIIYWEIIELSKKGNSFTAHIATSGIAELYLTLINRLDQRQFLCDVDIVVIEKQPSFNPKMRIIAGCLQTYFYIRGVVDKNRIKSVEFFSPKHKLKCYSGPELDISSKNGKIVKGKYAQTKKMGILIARSKLQEFNETPEWVNLFENSKKKDDLSDCYLQALTYILFKQPVTVKQVKVSNSTLKQQLKEYLDNLKNCSVKPQSKIDASGSHFKSIHEIQFPMQLPEPIETLLTKLSMKRYLTMKYLI
jgi:hypothetical protein